MMLNYHLLGALNVQTFDYSKIWIVDYAQNSKINYDTKMKISVFPYTLDYNNYSEP